MFPPFIGRLVSVNENASAEPFDELKIRHGHFARDEG